MNIGESIYDNLLGFGLTARQSGYIWLKEYNRPDRDKGERAEQRPGDFGLAFVLIEGYRLRQEQSGLFVYDDGEVARAGSAGADDHWETGCFGEDPQREPRSGFKLPSCQKRAAWDTEETRKGGARNSECQTNYGQNSSRGSRAA